MSIIMCGLLLFIMIAVIVVFVIGSIDFVEHKIDTKNKQTITYKQFLKISSCCPEKWDIYDGVPIRLRYYPNGKGEFGRGNSKEVYIHSFLDQKRLKRLYKKKEQSNNLDIWNKERAKLIKSWQQDINDFHDEYMDKVKTYYNKGKKL